MSINVENIKKVRDHIAALPAEQFDMREWHVENSCGTVACIGGWAEVVLFPDERWANLALWAAERAMGLGYAEAQALFSPPNFCSNHTRYTQATAVAALDRLIETSEVNWNWAIANPAQIGGAA